MDITRRHLLSTALPVLVALSGCGAPLKHCPFDRGNADPGGARLRVDYYGVACFQFTWAGSSVLLDPFFSRHPVFRSIFGEISTDPTQIAPYLPQLSHVSTVVVGHGHFDHMLDLPYLAPRLRPGTVVIGSQTLKHSLAALDLPLTWIVANPIAATPDTVGSWAWNEARTIRVMPITSTHATHLGPIHLYKQHLTADRSTPPVRAKHLQEGQPFAFLIDFMAPDGIHIAHRVYAQTSSAGHPSGAFPPALLAERAVDVAVVSMDVAKEAARGAPSVLDFVEPRMTFIGHWDSFFRTKDMPPREVPKINLKRLQRGLSADKHRQYRIPAIDSTHYFPTTP
jgi:L-ascorbate metabolism protein UlaG (beta-lactamase superfamily)